MLNDSETIQAFDCIKQLQVLEDSNKDEKEWIKQFESKNGTLAGANRDNTEMNGDTNDAEDDLMQATYE